MVLMRARRAEQHQKSVASKLRRRALPLIFGLVLFLLVNSYDPYPILLPIYGFFVIGIFSGHEPGDDEPVGRQSRILTIDKGRFTVRRARLAPAMISTPGHRASRRRQRGALPAWSRDAFSAPSTN